MCPDKTVPVVVTSPTPGSSLVPIQADAGANVTVRPGTTLSLTAKQVLPNVETNALTFLWVETVPATGGNVTLTGANTPTISFITPLQGTIGILKRTFEVTITHNTGSVSKKSVVVTTDLTAKDKVVIDSYTRVNSQSGTITVTAHSDLVGDTSAQMLISVNGGGFAGMTKVGTNTGKWSYTQRSTAANLPIVVKTRIGTTDYGTASSSAPAKRAVEFVA